MSTRFLGPLFYGVALLSGLGLMFHSIPASKAGFGADESFLYPQVILFLWIVFAAISLVQSVRSRSGGSAGSQARLVSAGAAIAFLCLALTPLGFLPTSFLFFCLYSFLLGYRNFPVVIGAALGTTAVLWFMFEKILGIPLPPGFIFG